MKSSKAWYCKNLNLFWLTVVSTFQHLFNVFGSKIKMLVNWASWHIFSLMSAGMTFINISSPRRTWPRYSNFLLFDFLISDEWYSDIFISPRSDPQTMMISLLLHLPSTVFAPQIWLFQYLSNLICVVNILGPRWKCPSYFLSYCHCNTTAFLRVPLSWTIKNSNFSLSSSDSGIFNMKFTLMDFIENDLV